MEKAEPKQFDNLQCTEVAKLFGVSLKAVGYWASKDGCPRNENGKYNLGQVIQWRESFIRKTLPAKSESKEKDGLRRKQLADAKIREMELLELQGKLIPIEQVKAGLVARITVLKRALLAMPRQLAGPLSGLDQRETQVLLQERISHLIRTFAGQNDPPARKGRR